MTPAHALSIVNADFKYLSDSEEFYFRDVWKVMAPGRMEGDCEDFSLTLLWLLADKNPFQMFWWLLTRKARLHFYKHETRGTGHVGLQFKDRYVDNITARWNDGSVLPNKHGYKRKFAMPVTFIAIKMLSSLPFLAFRK